jgi:RHS repeat-associated protein
VSSAYAYGAFGQDLASTGTARAAILDGVENGMRYRGLMYEPLTGLYHHRGRDYDPEIGRFLQPKTIAGLLGSPKTLNPYTFAFNNPVASPLIDLGRNGLGGLLGRLAGGADVSVALRRAGSTLPWLQAAEDVDGEGLATVALDAVRGGKVCEPAAILRGGAALFEEEFSLSASFEFNFESLIRIRLLGGKPRPPRVGDGILPGLNVLDAPRGAAVGAGVGGLIGRDDRATIGGVLGEGAGASNAPVGKTPF